MTHKWETYKIISDKYLDVCTEIILLRESYKRNYITESEYLEEAYRNIRIYFEHRFYYEV